MQFSAHTKALWLGVLGVTIFSLTFPLTRIAAPELGGAFVGLGRALVGAALAGLLLWFRREPFPKAHWKSIALVALGVVFGFPLFTSMALVYVPAAHGTIMIGLLPAATALMAVLLAGERPKPLFWGWTALGVAAVLGFAWQEGAGKPQLADGLLIIAVLFGGIGYAEGAKLARVLEGWRVICWALVVSAPVLVVPVFILAQGVSGSLEAWLAFAYVGCFSVFLGFFAWYKALAMGGITRIAPIQMVQPILSLLWAALIIAEPLSAFTWVAGVGITLIAWFTRQAA
jgi:drug/metabolite transporter (DMT)-like permease